MVKADYQRIENAISYIDTNYRAQPTLEEIANHIGLSEYHFHRLFQRWVGITPKRFLQYLTADHARVLLKNSRTVLDAVYETGLSSAGRLHDLFVTLHGATPGDIKLQGAGMTIEYGIHETPFGTCFIAITPRGVCALEFIIEDKWEASLKRLKTEWKDAMFICSQEKTMTFKRKIFMGSSRNRNNSLNLFVKGTNFQIKVWEALLRIPSGNLVTYQDIAKNIGSPRAPRAVGSAIGRNPVAFLIPCHRVIQKTGIIGEYHWGKTRKKAIIAWESGMHRTDKG